VHILQDFIPRGRKNRPGYKLTPKYITIHDTGNASAGAGAKNHTSYLKSKAAENAPVSWHFTVDDTNIYQHLPLDENGWHAGDGAQGTGNRQSIGIEICMNADGNRAKAEENAAWLTAKLLKDFNLPLTAIKQHYDWTKKNCPRVLRSRPGGWNEFIKLVKEKMKPPEQPPQQQTRKLYRVQVGAYSQKSNAEAMLKKIKAAGFSDAFIKYD
jgi:N-acetylmuramoyl-L-alanine amidase